MQYQGLNIKIDQPVPIREKVYQQLKNEILRDNIPQKTILVESQLAKQIGVSRTPVREALHILQKEGLLELVPKMGYRVREVDWDEVKEICEIRKSLEILAAKWAIKRIASNEILAIRRNLDNAEAMIASGDLFLFTDLDDEFHELLVQASGSQRLLSLVRAHRDEMNRYRAKSLHLIDTVSIAIEGHRQIFRYLVEKDEEGVEGAIRGHIEHAKKYIKIYAFENSENGK